MNELNNKNSQYIFSINYARFRNAIKAYRIAFPNDNRPEIELKRSAYELLRDPEVIEYIDEYYAKINDHLRISENEIAVVLLEIMNNGSETNRLKAGIELLKIIGNKEDIKDDIEIDINEIKELI